MVIPEKEREFLLLFEKLKKEVIEEEGNLMYVLARDKSDDCTYHIIEKYTDEEALQRHTSSDHFMEFFNGVKSLVTGPGVVYVMDEVT